jgi:hypothetical protein
MVKRVMDASIALAERLNDIVYTPNYHHVEPLELLLAAGCGNIRLEGSALYDGCPINAYSVSVRTDDGDLVTTYVAHATACDLWFSTEDGEVSGYDFGEATNAMDFWWLIQHCNERGELSIEQRIAYLREHEGYTDDKICDLVGDYSDGKGGKFVFQMVKPRRL